jgi:hypothetical protein
MLGSGLAIVFRSRPFAVKRAPHLAHVCAIWGVKARGPLSNTGAVHSGQWMAATRFPARAAFSGPSIREPPEDRV